MLSYFVCKIFIDLKILIIIFPAILGYQFVQSEKMMHAKVSKPVVFLRYEPNMRMQGAFSLIKKLIIVPCGICLYFPCKCVILLNTSKISCHGVGVLIRGLALPNITKI